jgi:hypothetical protein
MAGAAGGERRVDDVQVAFELDQVDGCDRGPDSALEIKVRSAW